MTPISTIPTFSDVTAWDGHDAKVQNARRYNLTQQQMSQFTDILKGAVNKTLTATDLKKPDVSPTVDGAYIKDFILGRMKNRLNETADTGYEADAFSQLSSLNSQDFLFNQDNSSREKADRFSSFLNLHFDLNTLQMLSGVK